MSDIATQLKNLAAERGLGVLRAEHLRHRSGKQIGLLLTLAPLAACSTDNGGLGTLFANGIPTSGGGTTTPTGSTTRGTPGNDTIDRRSSTEDENIDGLEGTDVILTGSGDDRIMGGPGNDQIAGGAGDDVIYGNDGVDDLSGGFGDDIIIGGPGRDTMDGGPGNDIFILIGTTGTDEYDLSAITNSGGQGLDLSSILSLSDINGHTASDAVAGEKIDGGGGFDTLVIYGDVDLSTLDLRFIDRLVVNSTVTMNASDIKAFGSLEGNGASRLIITNGGAGTVELNLADTPISGFRDIKLEDGVTLLVSDSTQFDGELIAISGTGTVKLLTTQVESATSPVAALMLDENLSLVDANDTPVDFQLAAVTLFNGTSEPLSDPQVVALGAGDTGTISGIDTIFEAVGDNITISGTGSPQSFNAIRWIPNGGDTLTLQGATSFERIFVDTTLSGDAVVYDGQTLTVGSASIVVGLNVPFAVADVAGGGLLIAFDDNLNHAPTDIAITNSSVNENDGGEPTVGLLSASDQDPTENLVFSLDASETRFEIVNGNQLKLTNGTVFDHEALTNGAVQLDVTVTDKAGETYSETLTVAVNDLNEAPSDISLSSASVDENAANAVIGQLSAFDPDNAAEPFGQHVFSVSDGRFTVDQTGQLIMVAAQNFETTPSLDVEVTVTDNNGTGLSFAETFTITINDLPDAPVITSPAVATVVENTTAVLTVTATDDDTPVGDLVYSIAGGDDFGAFDIDANTGALTFNLAPDFDVAGDDDQGNDYEVTVGVSDGTHTTTQDIVVSVTGVNEAPSITTRFHNFTHPENVTDVATIVVTDPENDTIIFSIGSGGDSGLFDITEGGVLQFKAAPDFENPADSEPNNTYSVEVVASDNEFSDRHTFTFSVVNANDPARFTSGNTFSAAENQTAIGTVTAADDDGNGIAFSIADGLHGSLFTIDPLSGVLIFNEAQDFENPNDDDGFGIYSLVVIADDGIEPAQQTITVNVTDVNEAPTGIGYTPALLLENELGASAGQLVVSDPDFNTFPFGQHSFTVSDNRFEVSDSGILKLKDDQSVDFETEPTIQVTVTATDNNGAGTSTSETFTVTVADQNDPVSILTLTSTGVDENTLGALVGQVNISDQDGADGPFGQHIYSVSDERLTISATGEVRLKPDVSLDFEDIKDLTFDVTVSDNNGNEGATTDTQSFTVPVNDVNEAPHTITLSNYNVAEGISGVAIGSLAATDPEGDAIQGFSVNNGLFKVNGRVLSVANGVVLDHESLPDGTISLDVTVTDVRGGSNTETLTINVIDVNEAPTDMTLGGNAVIENEAGVVIGVVNVVDQDDPASAFGQYDFTASDNRFEVDDQNQLKLKAGVSLDFEGEGGAGQSTIIPVTVTATDRSATQKFIIRDLEVTLFNANDLPTNLRIVGDESVDENDGDGDSIGHLFADDQDVGSVLTFSLDQDETRFEIVGGTELRLKDGVSLNHEDAETVSVFVTVSDDDPVQPGVLRKEFIVTVNDVNEAPADFALFGAGYLPIPENTPGAIIGRVTIEDPDNPDEPFGQHVGVFTGNGGTPETRLELVRIEGEYFLKLKDGISLDFETEPVLGFGMRVVDVNGAGLSSPAFGFGLEVADGNDAPDTIVLDNASVNENAAAAFIGNLSASDVDLDESGNPRDTLSFSTTDLRFKITGTQLSLAPGIALDHEGLVNGETEVEITVSDGTDETTETLTIIVNDQNEAPTGITIDDNTVAENVDGATIGVLTVEDPDAAGEPFGQHVFTVMNDTRFEIVNGNELKLRAGEALDFEEDGTFNLNIRATDNPSGLGNSVIFAVEIETLDRFEGFNIADMAANQGVVLTGETFPDRTGFSVAVIGDINGDGFADMAVGSPTAGPEERGFTHVVYGRGDGFPLMDGDAQIDLQNMLASDGFSITNTGFYDDVAGEGKEYAYHGVGYSVSGAGDLNGDGFEDLIIGAPGVLEENGDVAGPGKAYVIFGGAGGFGVTDPDTGKAMIDLYDGKTFHGFSFKGRNSNDRAGYSVSSAGDVNGDGFDDLIIAMPSRGYSVKEQGEVAVIFGNALLGAYSVRKPGRVPELDSYDIKKFGGFVVRGEGDYDRLGHSVSSTGDLNGDGFDDFIIGAPYAYGDGAESGDAYVIFGGPGGPGDRTLIDVDELTADQGFVLQGGANSLVGFSVANAGDVNGDGFDDLIIGAPDAYFGNGAAYILFGDDGGFGIAVHHSESGVERRVVNLFNLQSDQGVLIASAATVYSPFTIPLKVGDSVAAAGDVNGDGFADVIVGARYGFSDDLSSPDLPGAAYVVFGGETIGTNFGSGQAVILEFLELDEGAVFTGLAPNDNFGDAVSGAGDVNGDGFDDLLVGARYAGPEGSGEAYILFGGAIGEVVDRSPSTNVDGQPFIGGAGNDNLQNFANGNAGSILAGAGDDFIQVSTTNLSRVDGGHGHDVLEIFRSSVDMDLGDFAPGAITSIEEVRLNTGLPSTITVGELDVYNLTEERENGMARLIVRGSASDTLNLVGYNWELQDGVVETGGSFFDRWVSNNAEVLAERTGLNVSTTVFRLSEMTADEGFIIQGEAAYDNTGNAVSNAGDVNGDGFDDLLIGANRAGYAYTASPYSYTAPHGRAYVVFGGGDGFGAPVDLDGVSRQVLDLADLSGTQGIVLDGVTVGDRAGSDVAGGGDINGDGFADIIIGARGYSDNVFNSPLGKTYIVYGTDAASGTAVDNGSGVVRQIVNLPELAAPDGFDVIGDTYSYAVRIGSDVANLGDVNGDGFDDFIVASEDSGRAGAYYSGEAYIIYGSADAPDIETVEDISATQGAVLQGASRYDYAGESIAGAGDVNGDGIDDILVGASGANSDYGEVYLVFGRSANFGSLVNEGGTTKDMLLLGFENLEAADGVTIRGSSGIEIGRHVASAGDINGDGFDDMMITARNNYYGGGAKVFVVFGDNPDIGNERSEIDLGTGAPRHFRSLELSAFDANDGFVIEGGGGDSYFDFSDISSAGDVNGDGFDDMLIGLESFNYYRGADYTGDAGAFVIFGSGSGFGKDDGAGGRVLDLDRLTADQGFKIVADDILFGSEISVSAAGDINGDGRDDLIVGAEFGDLGGSNAGQAYVIFGQDDWL